MVFYKLGKGSDVFNHFDSVTLQTIFLLPKPLSLTLNSLLLTLQIHYQLLQIHQLLLLTPIFSKLLPPQHLTLFLNRVQSFLRF